MFNFKINLSGLIILQWPAEGWNGLIIYPPVSRHSDFKQKRAGWVIIRLVQANY